MGIVLFLLLLLCSYGNVGASDQALEQNKKQIESMTKTEREELLKKYRHFKKLSFDQKNDLRQLENTLRKDEKLREAKTVYYHWLGTLDPWERTELRKERDPKKRIMMVKKILAKQKSGRHGFQMDQISLFSDGEFPQEERLKFTGDELEKIFKILEKTSSFSGKDQKKLDGLESPLHKQIAIMVLLLDKKGKMPNEKVYAKLIQVISNDKIKEELENSDEPGLKARKFQMILTGSLLIQIKKEFDRQSPTEEQEKEYFSRLDSGFQDHLLSMPEEIRKRVLRRNYFDQNNRALSFDIKRFFGLIGKKMFRPPHRGSRFNNRKKFGPKSDKRPAKRKG